MDRTLDALTDMLPWLWQSSLQGGVLVLLILLVQWLFRKRLAPQWRYALWGVLVLRLMLVWAPSSSFSLYNLAPESTPKVFVVAPTPGMPVDVAPAVEAATSRIAESVGNTTLRGENPSLVIRDSRDARDITVPWSLADAAALSWLVVFASLLSLMSLQSLRFARQVRAGRMVTDSETLELLETCRRQLKVTTFVTLVETACVTSPALLGCVRPKLVVPPGFFDRLSPDAARYVFLHELAHVKRGDIWTSWLMNLLVALHWFNPAIWFARRRFIIDRETACDAHVLRHLDANAQRQYGVTLLDLMERFSTSQWAPGIAGISESNSNLKRRILMIKDFRSPTRLAAWSGVGLCLLIALATLTNAQVEKSGVDVYCEAVDIYGYTATNGGTMIAAQVTNSSAKDLVVDVEFWLQESDNMIGRDGLHIAAGKTGTKAIPWSIENGSYPILVRIDPDNSIAEDNENNNSVATTIVYKDGRFSQEIAEPVPQGLSRRGRIVGMKGDSAETETAHRVEVRESLVAQLAMVEELSTGDAPIPNDSPLYWIERKVQDDQRVVALKEQLAEGVDGSREALQQALAAQMAELRGMNLKVVRARLTGELQQYAGFEKLRTNEEIAQLADCANKLKQLGLVFKMYANESLGGHFPPLAQEPGRLMFAWGDNVSMVNGLPVLSTTYVSAPTTLSHCPASEAPVGPLPDDQDFIYLGYLLQNDKDVEDFSVWYREESVKAERGEIAFTEDATRTGTGILPLLRLREGIERFTITDISNPAASALAQSQIPTMIEWPRHRGGNDPAGSTRGGNVLYMDGHVEYVEYPGKWPMTEETITTLAKLAGRLDESSGMTSDVDDLVSAEEKRDGLRDALGKLGRQLEGTPKEGKNFAEGIVLGIGSAVNDQYRADCQNHMKHLGLAFKMFSSDSDRNVFPPLSEENGTLMFGWGGHSRANSNGALLSAEYIAGVEEVSRCPLSPLPAADTPGDQDYVYLGYLVKGDQSVRAFANAYRERVRLGGENLFEADLNFGDAPVYRLREGIERVFIPNGSSPESDTWTQSRLPVLIEWPDRHETSSDRQGGNVLFMDGHVEFMVYPGKWPMTEETIGILAELAGREPVELTHTGGMSIEELRKLSASANASEATPPLRNGRRGGGMQLGNSRRGLAAAAPATGPTFDMGGLDPDAPCGTRLKYLGLALKVFANESPKEVWPPLSRDAGNMMFLWGGDSDTVDGQEVLSTGFSPTIPATVVCRDSGRAIGEPDDTDFVYLGYVMRDEGDLRRFAQAYEAWAAAGADKNTWFTDDEPGSPEKGIIRIREGVERFLITNINNPAAAAMAQSNIPVVIEWPDHHVIGGTMGGNVLFMDGHEEFMAYPGDFPMTEETMDILCKLAGRDAIVVDQR